MEREQRGTRVQNPPGFSLRNERWIQTYTKRQNEENWKAYLAWSEFCRECVGVLDDITDIEWRPRDVEKGVFTAQNSELKLETLVVTD